MEWHSHAVNDQRHSRVHGCCVTTTLQGWLRGQEAQQAGPLECEEPLPLECGLAQRPAFLPIPTTKCSGQELDRLEGRLYFQGMTNWLCWLGESSDLPPAPFPRTTCRVDLFRSKLVWRSVSEPWEPKQPATEDDCNLGSIRELEARGLLLLVFLQPPHCRKGHSIPLREREGDKMAALNYMCNSPGGL